jgi:hypothetical protein
VTLPLSTPSSTAKQVPDKPFQVTSGYMGGYEISCKLLTLNGGNANDAIDAYVFYPNEKSRYQTVGKLKIRSYFERTFNLTFVPGVRLKNALIEISFERIDI